MMITAFSVLLLVGCTNQKPSISNEETNTTESNTITVSGGYTYYLQPDNSFAPYKESALNRVCFEPAQLETVNNGAIFCFNNTQESLNLFGFETVNTSCKYYWGTATIKIKNLSDKNLSHSKSDPCVEQGRCEFNEAELIEVIDSDQETPQCKQ